VVMELSVVSGQLSAAEGPFCTIVWLTADR
jgi:hypothetical protein